MSKYNLVDIFEEYKIGSGWTSTFDYEGMLKAGLKTGVDTDLNILKKMTEDYTDVNYHREASHLYDAIEALEEGAIKEASMFFGDFHAEIKETIKSQGMDIEPTLGKFMASKMEEDIKENKGLAEIEEDGYNAGVKSAYTYATIGSRLKNRPDKLAYNKGFIQGVTDELYSSLNEEDVEGEHSGLRRTIYENKTVGFRFGFDQKELDVLKLLVSAGEDDYLSDDEVEILKFIIKSNILQDKTSVNEGSYKEFITAVKEKYSDSEIQQYLDSVDNDMRLNGDEDYEGWSVADYLEDMDNYVYDRVAEVEIDESMSFLKEHFNRFK